jgi:hypothetical protein
VQSGIGASENAQTLRMPSAGNGESEAVKIEVLYVKDCPNHLPTVRRIQQVLAAESLRVPVHEVLVSSEAEAKALHFLVSPTVRVNGNDVERDEGPLRQKNSTNICVLPHRRKPRKSQPWHAPRRNSILEIASQPIHW